MRRPRNASDTFRAVRAHTVNPMERQAGLGRSLEEVLDSVPPIEPRDPAPTHALFGLTPDDPPVTNGHHLTLAEPDPDPDPSEPAAEADTKKNKKKKKSDRAESDKQKSKKKTNKKKKNKSKGKGSR